MAATEPRDPTRCVICGGPNLCERAAAAAEGREPGACWCAGEEFPAELFEQVPVAERNRRCICLSCLREAQRAQAG